MCGLSNRFEPWPTIDWSLLDAFTWPEYILPTFMVYQNYYKELTQIPNTPKEANASFSNKAYHVEAEIHEVNQTIAALIRSDYGSVSYSQLPTEIKVHVIQCLTSLVLSQEQGMQNFALRQEMEAEADEYDFFPLFSKGDDGSTNSCILCDQDGEMVCCDVCPAAYHITCLLEHSRTFQGDWACYECSTPDPIKMSGRLNWVTVQKNRNSTAYTVAVVGKYILIQDISCSDELIEDMKSTMSKTKGKNNKSKATTSVSKSSNNSKTKAKSGNSSDNGKANKNKNSKDNKDNKKKKRSRECIEEDEESDSHESGSEPEPESESEAASKMKPVIRVLDEDEVETVLKALSAKEKNEWPWKAYFELIQFQAENAADEKSESQTASATGSESKRSADTKSGSVGTSNSDQNAGLTDLALQSLTNMDPSNFDGLPTEVVEEETVEMIVARRSSRFNSSGAGIDVIARGGVVKENKVREVRAAFVKRSPRSRDPNTYVNHYISARAAPYFANINENLRPITPLITEPFKAVARKYHTLYNVNDSSSVLWPIFSHPPTLSLSRLLESLYFLLGPLVGRVWSENFASPSSWLSRLCKATLLSHLKKLTVELGKSILPYAFAPNWFLSLAEVQGRTVGGLGHFAGAQAKMKLSGAGGARGWKMRVHKFANLNGRMQYAYFYAIGSSTKQVMMKQEGGDGDGDSDDSDDEKATAAATKKDDDEMDDEEDGGNAPTLASSSKSKARGSAIPDLVTGKKAMPLSAQATVPKRDLRRLGRNAGLGLLPHVSYPASEKRFASAPFSMHWQRKVMAASSPEQLALQLRYLEQALRLDDMSQTRTSVLSDSGDRTINYNILSRVDDTEPIDDSAEVAVSSSSSSNASNSFMPPPPPVTACAEPMDRDIASIISMVSGDDQLGIPKNGQTQDFMIAARDSAGSPPPPSRFLVMTSTQAVGKDDDVASRRKQVVDAHVLPLPAMRAYYSRVWIEQFMREFRDKNAHLRPPTSTIPPPSNTDSLVDDLHNLLSSVIEIADSPQCENSIEAVLALFAAKMTQVFIQGASHSGEIMLRRELHGDLLRMRSDFVKKLIPTISAQAVYPSTADNVSRAQMTLCITYTYVNRVIASTIDVANSVYSRVEAARWSENSSPSFQKLPSKRRPPVGINRDIWESFQKRIVNSRGSKSILWVSPSVEHVRSVMPKGVHEKDVPYLDPSACLTTQSALKNVGGYYLPQVGDELVYYTSGHKEYLLKYPDPFRSSLLGSRMGLVTKRKEFDCIPCRVLTVDYEFPHSVYKDPAIQCVIQLGSLASHTNKIFYILYRPGHSVGEFLIPRLQFQTMFARKWNVNQETSIIYAGGERFDGTILDIKRDEEYYFPSWNGVKVRFSTYEIENVNEWELEAPNSAVADVAAVDSTLEVATSSTDALNQTAAVDASNPSSVTGNSNVALNQPSLQQQQQQQEQVQADTQGAAGEILKDSDAMDVDTSLNDVNMMKSDNLVASNNNSQESCKMETETEVEEKSHTDNTDNTDNMHNMHNNKVIKDEDGNANADNAEGQMHTDDSHARDESEGNGAYEPEQYKKRASSRTCVIENSFKQLQSASQSSSQSLSTTRSRDSSGGGSSSGPMPTAADFIEEYENRIKDINPRLEKIASRMLSKDEYSHFVNPVSHEDVPDYCRFVSVCITLTLMHQRASNFYYRQPEAFLGDARTIYINSVLFNTEQSFIAGKAASLYRDILRELTLEFQEYDFGDYVVFEACLAEKEPVSSLLVACKPLDWVNVQRST